MRNNFAVTLFILFPAILFFLKIVATKGYFMSDDFDHLYLSSNYSYGQFIKYWLDPVGLWVGHRIIFGFWLFKAVFDLFGTNIFFFNLMIFLLNALNVVLLYRMLSLFSKHKTIRIFTCFVFASFYLDWISNVHELLGGTFLILTMTFWLKYLGKQKTKYIFFTTLFYIFSILTKEITFLVFPALALMAFYYHLNIKKLDFRKILITNFPLIIIFVLYSLFFAFGFLNYFSDTGGYKMGFNIKIIFTNILDYIHKIFRGLSNPFWGLLFFIVIALSDFWRRKPAVIFFLISGSLFLMPALFFEYRTSLYYLYYLLIFFSIGFVVFSNQLFAYYRILSKEINPFVVRFVLSFLMVVIFITVFGLGKQFRDNCFLIQFPQINERGRFIEYLASFLDSKIEEGAKPGSCIKINSDMAEDKLDMVFLPDIIHLFLQNKKASLLRFEYNGIGKCIYVKKN